jgi:putative copper export protein
VHRETAEAQVERVVKGKMSHVVCCMLYVVCCMLYVGYPISYILYPKQRQEIDTSGRFVKYFSVMAQIFVAFVHVVC